MENLCRQSFCRALIPAPLGEDRERFLRLVKDIRTRRDDYAAQLGHQTLAGISSAAGRRAESKSSIVGSLLAGHGIRDVGDDRRRLLLWQARLLLKLAEMHGADQEELRQQVGRIREKEQALFAGLREEGERSFVLPAGLDPGNLGPAALRLQRKAWTRLLVLGSAAETPPILVSADLDGVDLLAETYEKVAGAPPRRLGRLILPTAYPLPAQFIEQVRLFREEGQALLARVHGWLGGQAAADASAWFSPAEEESWTNLLARWFPQAECGRTGLTLFACPGRSLHRLMAETFAPEELEFLPPSEPEAGGRLVLGLLEGAG
jgi:hypothetical protein